MRATTTRTPSSVGTTARAVEVVIVYLPGAARVRINRSLTRRPPSLDGFLRLVRRARDAAAALHDLAGRTAAAACTRRTIPIASRRRSTSASCRRSMPATHRRAHRMLGAQPRTVDGVAGVQFAVWAPQCRARQRRRRLQPVGRPPPPDARARFRGRLGAVHARPSSAGALYKFEIRNRDNGTIHLKIDPYGRAFELRPATASVVAPPSRHLWQDGEWLSARGHASLAARADVDLRGHLGSWQRRGDGGFLTYREIADRLIAHVRRPRLHAPRVPAHHRASARRFLGLPGHRLFRAHQPSRRRRRSQGSSSIVATPPASA